MNESSFVVLVRVVAVVIVAVALVGWSDTDSDDAWMMESAVLTTSVIGVASLSGSVDMMCFPKYTFVGMFVRLPLVMSLFFTDIKYE
jgi:hypothetical protein